MYLNTLYVLRIILFKYALAHFRKIVIEKYFKYYIIVHLSIIRSRYKYILLIYTLQIRNNLYKKSKLLGFWKQFKSLLICLHAII